MKKSVEKIFVFACAGLLSFGVAHAQISKGVKSGKATGSKSQDSKLEQTVLATVGDEKITYGDVQRAFRKNMNRKDANLSQVSRDSVMDFLNLYVRYRLKVKDALDKGFDKDSSVNADIAQNRKMLAETYFYDKKLVEPNVERLVQRRMRELEIAVMLFSPGSSSPSPEDTLKAYQRALRALAAVKKGASFESVAKDSSDDKETAQNGGVIKSMITSSMILRPVEDVAYSLKPGEVSQAPIKTQFGYFLVKTLRNEPRTLAKVRHILVVPVDNDTAGAVRKADSLIALIRGGADFGELAKSNSEDKSGAAKGGEVGGFYSRSMGFEGTQGRLIKEFEDAMFTLKDGQISGKILTPYGFHIIRRDSSKTPSLAEERELMKKTYRKLYYEDDRRAMLDSLRRSHKYQFSDVIFDQFLSAVDSTKSTNDTTWRNAKGLDELKGRVFVSTDSYALTVGGFLDSLRRSEFRGYSLTRASMKRAVDKITEPIVVKRATATMEKDYPDFAALMKEFRDGILLFKVEEQQVWTKLKFDSAMARGYWDTTRTRYKTEPKYDISEIYLLGPSDSLAKDVRRQIEANGSFDKLAAQYTAREGFREKEGRWGAVTARENKLAALFRDQGKSTPGSIIGPISYERGYTIVRLNAMELPREKTFEEAIADFAPAYQDLTQKRLTEEWLSTVRTKHRVDIKTATLDQVLKPGMNKVIHVKDGN